MVPLLGHLAPRAAPPSPPPLSSVRRGRAWPHLQRKATGMGDTEVGVGTQGRGDRKGVTDEPSTHIYTCTHTHTHVHTQSGPPSPNSNGKWHCLLLTSCCNK